MESRAMCIATIADNEIMRAKVKALETFAAMDIGHLY